EESKFEFEPTVNMKQYKFKVDYDLESLYEEAASEVNGNEQAEEKEQKPPVKVEVVPPTPTRNRREQTVNQTSKTTEVDVATTPVTVSQIEQSLTQTRED